MPINGSRADKVLYQSTLAKLLPKSILQIFDFHSRTFEEKHSAPVYANDGDPILNLDAHQDICFQRVSISGDNSGVPLEDLERAGLLLIKVGFH